MPKYKDKNCIVYGSTFTLTSPNRVLCNNKGYYRIWGCGHSIYTLDL